MSDSKSQRGFFSKLRHLASVIVGRDARRRARSLAAKLEKEKQRANELGETCKSLCPAAMTALVQSEVAERLAAAEGSKTRGLAGVLAQLDYDVRIVRRVPATCFWPRPQVGSSVVRLDRHERNAALTVDERRTLRSLAKRAFSQRRKQLGRVFKYMVQSTARAEELSNEDWVALAKELVETKGIM